MVELLVMFRNFIIALVLGWLGFSLQPADNQDQNDQSSESVAAALFSR